jgi:ribosome-associated toxin RatA of RatAB toxin-antitoxin module
MQRLNHAVDIDRALPEVYRLARQVERYPEFLPGYIESSVQEIQKDRLLLARKAVMRGKVRAWKSWVRFTENDCIDFEHAAGPLKGMNVHWQFSALGPACTHLEIIHRMQVRWPLGLGRLFEKWVAAPQVSEMAEAVVRAFKNACEACEILS